MKQEKYVMIYRLHFEAFYPSMFCTIPLFGPDYKYRLKTFVSNVIKKSFLSKVSLGWMCRVTWMHDVADTVRRLICTLYLHAPLPPAVSLSRAANLFLKREIRK